MKTRLIFLKRKQIVWQSPFKTITKSSSVKLSDGIGIETNQWNFYKCNLKV